MEEVVIHKSTSQKGKLEIFCDGVLWRVVSLQPFITVIRYASTSGCSADFRKYFAEKEKEAAYRYCRQLLTRKAFFSYELSQKLEKAGFAKQAIDHALCICEDHGLIDDDARADAWMAKAAREKRGLNTVKAKLLRLGVKEDIIQHAAKEYRGDFKPQIQYWIEKKQGRYNITIPKERAKLMQFLLRKGFSFEQITSVISTI